MSLADAKFVSVDELIAAARSMKGKPWVHQARSPDSGVDCLGFMLATVSMVGLPYGHVRRDYGRTPSEELYNTVASVCVQTDTVVAGAMALFQWPSEKHPRHFALVVNRHDGLGLLHADARRGVVTEHGFKGAWRRWHHSTWLIPGVAYE